MDYKGPIGSSQTARLIRYAPGICADTGLTSETFIPYLGMVRRTQTSFIGERSQDLGERPDDGALSDDGDILDVFVELLEDPDGQNPRRLM